MEFGFTEGQLALRKAFDDFFAAEMKNAPSEWWTSIEAIYSNDDCWEFHKQTARKLASRGWLSRPWPAEYGGQNAPLIEQFMFSEVMGYHKGAGVDPLGIGVLAPTLLVSGNDDQKREQLPPMARGECFWCQCWSEPNSGSDLASLVTRAVRVGDEYVINGQKIWTTGAHRADWCNTLARTNPDERRSKGLSFFLVDMRTPGITVNPIRFMDGSHMFNEVFFDNVRVPARNMVGEENQGWLASQMTSNFERSMIAVFSACKRELEDLAEFCKQTSWGNGTLAENLLVRHRLAQLAIEVEAGLAFAYSVLWNQVKGGLVSAGPMAAASKVLASELLQRLTYAGCDIMGLYGQVRDSRWAAMRGSWEKDYQLCLGINMGGGTSEVMRNLISSMGLGLPRSW